MNHKFLLFACSVLFLLFGVQIASAATLQITTGKTSFAIGDEFGVDIKVDSGGTGINAVQATVQVPKDMLQIVSAEKTGSVLNFWISDPAISSDGGQVSFVGGSVSGFTGKTLQILHLVMKVKGSGAADITFTDGAVTANDGSGTNILSAMKGLSITSLPSSGATPVTAQPAVAQPTQITRPAIKVSGLPAKPQIQIPLYPDPQKWYNISIPFSAQWNLPTDITDVATAIDKNPSSEPSRSQGLFDNEQFPLLTDGIWYLHVQFKNNVGWGPVTNYRIAIDTTPPLAFPVTFDQGTSTDNPTPTIHFKTGDPSGIARYYIQIDNGNQINIQPDTYTLTPQEPGRHAVRIGAEDLAGNITEDLSILEILPIASPVITSVNKSVYVGEDNFQISGSTSASTTVKVLLKGIAGDTLVDIVAKPDDNGNWHEQISQGLPSGSYYFEIRSVDGRGALSLPVKSETFSVKVKPFFIIGGIELSIGWFFGLIILLLLAGVGSVWALLRLKVEQQSRKVTIAQRDIDNAIIGIKKDIDTILAKYSDGKIDEAEVSEIEHLAKRISANLDRFRKYIVEDVGDINK